MKVFFLVNLIFGFSTAFAAPLYVLSGGGHTSFLAVGRPSAIQIRGEGVGPTGELSANKGDGVLSGVMEVDLTALKTGIELRDRHMKEKYLKTGEFPKARLEISALVLPKSGVDTEQPFAGILEIKGVKKPVQGFYALKKKDGQESLEARLQIRISDFGIDLPSYAGIKVTDTVDIQIQSGYKKSERP